MDFRRVIGVAILVAIPAISVAKPVYLKCKLDGNDKSFDVSVDEDEGRVTLPVVPVFSGASFTATEITFERETRARSGIESDEYTIDRRTLVYKNVWSSWSAIDGKRKEVTSTGQCEVAKPPERKI